MAIQDVLAQNTAEGELYRKLEDGKIQCFACAHRCRISDGKAGVCRVRFNSRGKLLVPAGYVSGLQEDPIEKKPFFHFLPGSRAMSFGMLGCNFHCSFCQNWVTSQTLQDPQSEALFSRMTDDDVVRLALQNECDSVISTYNEPLITAEWAVRIFKKAKKEQLLTGFVSNGNATPEVLDYLRPWLDAYKVDLKTFLPENYRSLGGNLESICEGIRGIYKRGFWMEIVTLLIPGWNDSEEELKQMTGFVASVSPEIPWHVTAFHQDYHMQDKRETRPEDLLRAVQIAKKAGLHYVYSGNLPGSLEGWENTRCRGCHETLIRRAGFRVLENRIGPEGKCSHCNAVIPGIWNKESECLN